MQSSRNPLFDEVAGVAALDPTVAATKKFIKENRGQPNLLQFLNTEQGKKLDPNLAGAMIVLEQLENARDRAPKGPMPTTSVVQDMGIAAAQAARQQQIQNAMRQGITQLPNPAMARAQFQGGITQPMNAAQGGLMKLAGGGPIAFQNRGVVPQPLSPDTNYQAVYEQFKTMPYTAGIIEQALTPQDALNLYSIALETEDEETLNKLRPYLARSGLSEQMGEVFRSVRGEKAEAGRQVSAARQAERERQAAAEKQRRIDEQNARINQLRTGQAAPPTAPAIATGTPSTIASPTDVALAGTSAATSAAPPAGGAQPPRTEVSPYDPLKMFTDLQRANDAQYGGVMSQIGGMRKQIDTMGREAEAARPRTREVILDEVGKTYERLGIGQATKAYLENIKNREAELKEDYKQERWMSLAQAGFSMANAAATNPQAGFLGALAVGGMEGAKRYTSALKDFRKASSQLQDARFSVAQAQENLMLNQNKEAQDILNRETTRFDNLRTQVASATLDLTKTLISAESARYQADSSTRGAMARLLADPDYLAFAEQRGKGLSPTESVRAVTQAKSPRAGAGLDMGDIKAAYEVLGGETVYARLAQKKKAGTISTEEAQTLQQLERLRQSAISEVNPMGLRLKEQG